MKKSLLFTFVLMLLYMPRISGQASTVLNHSELLQKFYGEWQQVTKNDTVLSFRMLPDSNSVIQTNYSLIKGKKQTNNVVTYKYDPNDESFEITIQGAESQSVKWMGYFIDELTLRIDKLKKESGETIEVRLFELDNPETITSTFYNAEGDIYNESKWTRISVP
jgi:hypothetical protein